MTRRTFFGSIAAFIVSAFALPKWAWPKQNSPKGFFDRSGILALCDNGEKDFIPGEIARYELRRYAKQANWDMRKIISEPGWVYAGDKPGFDTTILTLDGNDIRNRCFAFHPGYLVAACYLPVDLAGGFLKDPEGNKVVIIERGNSLSHERKLA